MTATETEKMPFTSQSWSVFSNPDIFTSASSSAWLLFLTLNTFESKIAQNLPGLGDHGWLV